MGRHETELVAWLRRHAAGLSYLSTSGVLKQQLHEAASAIEGLEVKVERDADGKWVIGRMAPQGWLWRHLTRREQLAIWLLRGETEIRP